MRTLQMTLSILALVAICTGSSYAAGPDPDGAIGQFMGTREVCDRIPVCSASVLANGEAWAGGGLLWQTDFNDHTLKLIDVDNSCEVLRTCPAPGDASPSENAYNGQYLYHYDFGTGLMYEIDPETCQVMSSGNPPGDDSAEGLTYDYQTGLFWKGDSSTLYGFTYVGGVCTVMTQCANPAGDSADGLAVCGRYLLMLGYSGTIYQFNLDTCELVSSCELNAGPAGNGITSDLVSTLWVDQPGAIDIMNRQCDQPVPVQESSWDSIKSFYR
jgi:hypothetical protein